jgi:hypothetical protein
MLKKDSHIVLSFHFSGEFDIFGFVDVLYIVHLYNTRKYWKKLHILIIKYRRSDWSSLLTLE